MAEPCSGFGNRMFLDEAEWRTYLRRMPVRYIKKKHSPVCDVCGLPPFADNPLQHSHRIGFNVGIRKLGLTPDFLDSDQNIVSAHRKVCNASAEMSHAKALQWLEGVGELPTYVVTSI